MKCKELVTPDIVYTPHRLFFNNKININSK